MRPGVLLGVVLLLSIATGSRTYKTNENDFKFSEEDMTDLLVEVKELTDLEDKLEEQLEIKHRKKIQEEFLRLEEEAKKGEKPYFHNEYYDDEAAWMNDDTYLNDAGDYDGSGSGDNPCINEEQLPCANLKYTFCESQRCDGNEDCPDGDDEEGCKCRSNEFECDVNKCMSKEKHCDDREDCTDGADEKDCDKGNSCMDEEQRTCANPRYTFCESQRCDDIFDCPDSDDEEGCEVTCSVSEFQCDNKCIPMEKRCDQNYDCRDRLDEEDCDCEKSEFRCDGVCLTLEKKCDNVDDCSDGTDEDDCDCSKNMFKCDKKCISLEKKCDGKNDCKYGNDEKNCECSYMGKGYSKGDRLPDTCTELICNNGKWIPTGSINQDCSECTLYNDPHIKTYENMLYDWHGQCNYSITQQGKTQTPDFALYGKFDQCLPGISKPTCLGEFVYKDSDTFINFGAKMSQEPTRINLFYLSVNGVYRQVVSSNFATTLNVIDTEQDVLAWRVDDCLRILGTRGIMIHYCGWGIHVWAHPTIKRSVYGLCGKITGGSDGLVGRDGSSYEEPVSSWPNNQIDMGFAVSWQTSDQTESCTHSSNRHKRQIQESACEASNSELKKYKNSCSKKIQRDISDDRRKQLIEDCAFDRCVITEARIKNPSANYPDPDEWLNQNVNRSKRQADIVKNTTDFTATTTASKTTTSTTTASTTTSTTTTSSTIATITASKTTKTFTSATTTPKPFVPPKGCFEELEGSTGEIVFPADGHHYENNQKCTWTIKSLPDTVIKITFLSFNTEENYDKLSIWDGKNDKAQPMASFSGNKMPKELISSFNYVYLQFTSDRDGSGNGFRLRWQQILNKGCEKTEFECDKKCLTVEKRCNDHYDCKDKSDESFCECEYAGKKYPRGVLLPDVCAALICKHGMWYPTGSINQDCSECTVYNDPHIRTYENVNYDWHGQCNYSITQQGKTQKPSFALYCKFDQCLPGISKPTCLGEFVYKDSDTLSIRFGSPMSMNQKENYIFYIKANGFSQLVNTSSFALGLQVGESDRDVLAWRNGGCLRILGTRGLMIHYCGWGIHVWAHPKISSNIFGLCGLHSGAGSVVPLREDRNSDRIGKKSSLVSRDGTPYDDSVDRWPNNQIDSGFADSWKTQSQSPSCSTTRRSKRQTENSGCPLDSKSPELKKYRTVCSKKVGQNLTSEQNQRLIDDCIFDRCVIMKAKDENPSADYPDPDDWLNQIENRSKRQAEINKNTTDITAVTTPNPIDPEQTTVPSDIVYPCGSNLSDSQGVLKYPVGIDNYLNNETCEWMISAPKGINITLTFDTFDTQLDMDFLHIWDGDSEKSEILAQISGNFDIPKLTSSSNYLYLRFTSGESVTATGFRIKWSANTGDCFYNGTLYKEDESLPDVCTGLVCKGGKWHPNGQINSQCSECTVYNDPHFKTFENVRYDWHGHCNYSITQIGKSLLPEFALYGKFDECLSNVPNPTCLAELVYKDAEDVFVEFGASFIQIQHGRSLFHVVVNGQKQKVTSSSFAESLNGTIRSILAWEENECLKIVGTQGFTIQYCGWGLHIWAHRDLQNKLFGLCGRHSNKTESKSPSETRKFADGLIARNGIYHSRPVTGSWPNNQVDDGFAKSWETQEQSGMCQSNKYSQRRHKRAIKASACKADKEKLLKYKEDCETKVSNDLPDIQRKPIIDDCAFDRCVLLDELEKNNSSALPDPEIWLNETTKRAQRQLHMNKNIGNITDATVPPGTTTSAGLGTTMKSTVIPGCGNKEWQCGNKQCISAEQRCNHVYDCNDNSDEVGCKDTTATASNSTATPSTVSQVTTATTSISNETSLTTKASTIAKTTTTMKTSMKPGCGFGMWRCNDGQCIKLRKRCDKNYDCKDKSDESRCTNCGEGKWQCSDKFCIDANKRCNGKYDCLDYSDEKNCKVCEVGQWQCTEGSCIEEFQRCDGVYDCFDHTDEVNCKDQESANVFVCHEGTRLFWWQRCDGIIDCPDYSDEWSCQPNYYWNYWG